jgi:hypothetical protein
MQAFMPNYSPGQEVSETNERIKACGCPNADLQVVGYMLDIGGGEGIVGQMKLQVPPRICPSESWRKRRRDCSRLSMDAHRFEVSSTVHARV